MKKRNLKERLPQNGGPTDGRLSSCLILVETRLKEPDNVFGTYFAREYERFDRQVDDLPEGERQLEHARKIDEAVENVRACLRRAVGLPVLQLQDTRQDDSGNDIDGP